jgi:hypothetical protein
VEVDMMRVCCSWVTCMWWSGCCATDINADAEGNDRDAFERKKADTDDAAGVSLVRLDLYMVVWRMRYSLVTKK